jgi:hypothetical protein
MEIIKFNEIMPTKSNINLVALPIIKSIEDGNFNVLEFQVKARFLIEVLNNALKNTKDDAIKDVQKGTTNYLGAKLEIIETGTKYEYSTNQDWQELENQIIYLKKAQKEIEDLIKIATKKEVAIVNPNTGETIMPVVKQSETNLKITLEK